MYNGISGGYAGKSITGSQVGVVPSSSVSNQYITGIGSDGVITRAQPSTNNLSDYTTGTWTPTDQSGAGLTLSSVSARYITIGNLVICWVNLFYPSTSDSVNNAVIGGLPFTIANAPYNAASVRVHSSGASSAKAGRGVINTTTFTLRDTSDTQVKNNVNSGQGFWICLEYYK